MVSSSKGTVGSSLPKPAVDGSKTDKMEESLTCVICQDLLHDCVRSDVENGDISEARGLSPALSNKSNVCVTLNTSLFYLFIYFN